MAESNINTGLIDVQSELDQIKALGQAIGVMMIDDAQIDREHVGELGYLVFHLAGEVEKKLNEQLKMLRPEAQKAKENNPEKKLDWNTAKLERKKIWGIAEKLRDIKALADSLDLCSMVSDHNLNKDSLMRISLMLWSLSKESLEILEGPEEEEEAQAAAESPNFQVLKGGILLHVGMLDKLVAPLAGQEAEISPDVLTNFRKELSSWRLSFEKFFNEKGAGL